jgi:hypothetical protein
MTRILFLVAQRLTSLLSPAIGREGCHGASPFSTSNKREGSHGVFTHWSGILAMTVLSVFWCALPARADGLDEYRLKAAFLYNFISFTEWPAGQGSTLNLCIYGPDPFGENLDRLKGKQVGRHTLAIRRTNTADTLKDCQIIFITRTVISNLPRVQEDMNGKPVLLVSDSPGAARGGIALNMIVDQNTILFEANLSAVRKNQLVLSSKLLKLAKEIYE